MLVFWQEVEGENRLAIEKICKKKMIKFALLIWTVQQYEDDRQTRPNDINIYF